MPQLSQRQMVIAGAVVAFVFVLGFLIFFNGRKTGGSGASATIHVWGFDPAENFSALTAKYQTYRSNVKIDYTAVSPDGYRNALLSAIAAGNGPDVFMIENRDLPQYRALLSPAPATQLPMVQFESNFPQVAENDFVSDGKIYAAPLYIDTLAMLYNKDFINSAGIAVLPATWNDFDATISPLQLATGHSITRSAVALGGTENTVHNATDILSLLMLQNGTKMVDDRRGAASFSEGSENPGLAALNFYTQFANPASSLYSWDENAGVSSHDSFGAGKVAVIFDYKSALATIKAKSPFLHVGVANMLQPQGSTSRIDYAKYAGLGVSKKSVSQDWAWDFVIYATSNTDGVNAYLSVSGEPSALRSIITTEESDTALSVFAKQALTAQSWYEIDSQKIDIILNSAIAAVLTGQTTSATALREAEAQITQLMRK